MTVTVITFLFVIKEKPLTPASEASVKKDYGSNRVALKSILTNRNYLLLLVCFTTVTGS